MDQERRTADRHRKGSPEKGERPLIGKELTMKELLLYVAKQLVDHPEAVTVTEREDAGATVLELRVAPEDLKVLAVVLKTAINM